MDGTKWPAGTYEVFSVFVGPLEIHVDGLKVAEVGHKDARTCMAIADLFAAAPDLAEALVASTSMLRNLRDYLRKHEASLPPLSLASLEVRLAANDAALARARGDAQ